jgi:hypothetical protein
VLDQQLAQRRVAFDRAEQILAPAYVGARGKQCLGDLGPHGVLLLRLDAPLFAFSVTKWMPVARDGLINGDCSPGSLCLLVAEKFGSARLAARRSLSAPAKASQFTVLGS